MTVKLFAFQSVNSYSSLFYIAFFKGRLEGCADNDCLAELGVQLGFIYIITFCLNLVEIGLPVLTNFINLYTEKKKIKQTGNGANLTLEEYEFNLSPYETPLDDYMEVIIGYGYVALFALSFPFSPLLALFLCVIELRVDAWKLCRVSRRIFPTQDNSIGVWLSIIQVISFIGAATNTGLIIFTTDVFDFDRSTDRWICFIAIEHGLFVIKMIISAFIPDIPEDVNHGVKWSQRIRSEKLWGKFTDIDKEREIRNLVFTPIENKRKMRIEEVMSPHFEIDF